MLLMPPPILPVSKDPPSAVAVWVTPSLFVHVTVSPTETSILDGEYANPEMVTSSSAAITAGTSGDSAAMAASSRARDTIRPIAIL